MKICVFTHTFPRFPKDVAAPFMDGVARSLVSAGNEVFVLTPFSPLFDMKIKRPYKILTYKYAPFNSWHKLGYSETLSDDRKMKLVMLLLSPFMFICGFFSLYSLIRRERIDLVNAHWILPNGFIASFASLLLGTPLVSTLPGSDVYMADRNRFYRFMARFATKHSIHVTSNSPQLISDLIDINTHEAKIKEELLLKTSPIIYGVDPKKFFPTTKWKRRISKQFNIPLTDRVIVAVGRLVAKKGFRYLIEAAPAILKKYPSTKFVVIGEGDARSDLEERVQHLGIKDSFRFPGWVDYAALIHYYNYSDIFILPSIRDQDGNLDDQSVSVIEAMSCGKPIVTTDFPGYKLVVRDGVNGYLVPEKNSRAISKSIIALLKSPILRRKMGQASRKLVQTNFSWPKIGEQYTKLFSQYVNLEYSSDIPQILNEKSRLKKAEQIESFLQIVEIVSKQKRCLDVGSSSGIITAKLARHFKTVLGVDFDPVAIEKAKKKFSKIKNLSFKVMDATDLALSDSSFDVVICNQVYCDVSDPKKLMQEIYRVLKPGGVCFFGARNKYVLVEREYDLPLLSFLPKSLARLYIRIVRGKKAHHIATYKSYGELRTLTDKFDVEEYTGRILKDPSHYGFTDIPKIVSTLFQVIPFGLLNPIIPNYIWILRKR